MQADDILSSGRFKVAESLLRAWEQSRPVLEDWVGRVVDEVLNERRERDNPSIRAMLRTDLGYPCPEAYAYLRRYHPHLVRPTTDRLRSGRFELTRLLLGDDEGNRAWVAHAIDACAFWLTEETVGVYQRRLGYPSTTPLVCQRPPRGWWCTRRPGHGGPCAALPQVQTYERAGAPA